MAEPQPPPNIITTELPMEILLFNILPRLPAKSLRRFMSVCKQWHSLITTPSFAKIHLHHLTNNDHQNHHKLLVLSLSEPYEFHTIDCETPKDPSPATRFVPFEGASWETFSIVTSLHGMLCVGITKSSREDAQYSQLILWNPLTGEYKMLSKAGSDTECYMKTKSPFGLYYSSSDDDYKILRVTNFHAAYMYSLKSDSWRKVVKETYSFEQWVSDWLSHKPRFLNNWFSYTWEPTAFLNEQLYFLKQATDGDCFQNSYSILMFDTKTQNFTEIATPSFRHQLTTCSSFMVHRDRIHLCVTIWGGDCNVFDYNIELWRMDGDGDWTKVVNYRPMSSDLWNKYPLHLMRNGNWLMHALIGGGIVQLDMDKQTTDVVYPNMIDMGIYITLRGKYIETIVSPNQYMK
ncbi:unnamed protein product [Lactuca virosa]|uniref:F-box domain-containing protein n=1 Tax=Lactuca virosa TaxID=75947 RepID=A0AAU9MMM0_9ASTR|nr:unnamed protein product [Lactuca virosa]